MARQFGFSFIADAPAAERVKKAVQSECPEATVKVIPGYEHVEPKRYSVLFPVDESMTKAVAKAEFLYDIVTKARQEADENVTI